MSMIRRADKTMAGANNKRANQTKKVTQLIYEPWHVISNNVAFWQV